MTYIASLLITFLIGLLCGIVSYIVFRKYHLGVWAFLAGIAPDWPRIFLEPLEVKGLENLLLITHTLGIFLFPIILIIVDITLIELGMVTIIKPFTSYLPEKIKSLVKVEDIIEKLRKYGVFPFPTRVGFVYLIGIFGGAVHLGINLLLGTL